MPKVKRAPSVKLLISLVLVVCGGSVLPALGAEAPREDGYLVKTGLVYSEAGGGLTLDLFLPKSLSKPVPCVVVIQGGGFLPQDGQRFRPFAVYLAEHGFAAALISYRGRPDHAYLDTIADTKAALRYLRAVSAENNIDPDRIGATGRSAGGTLAAMLAVTGGMPEFEGTGGHPEQSSRIQAAVAYAGVFDFVSRFTDPDQLALQPNWEEKTRTNGEWIGVPFSKDAPEWTHASAVTHVDAADAPTLFLHCKDDATVPWIQSRDMCARMQAAGTASGVKYYDRGGHGFSKLDEVSMGDMLRFFQETLGRPE